MPREPWAEDKRWEWANAITDDWQLMWRVTHALDSLGWMIVPKPEPDDPRCDPLQRFPAPGDVKVKVANWPSWIDTRRSIP